MLAIAALGWLGRHITQHIVRWSHVVPAQATATMLSTPFGSVLVALLQAYETVSSDTTSITAARDAVRAAMAKGGAIDPIALAFLDRAAEAEITFGPVPSRATGRSLMSLNRRPLNRPRRPISGFARIAKAGGGRESCRGRRPRRKSAPAQGRAGETEAPTVRSMSAVSSGARATARSIPLSYTFQWHTGSGRRVATTVPPVLQEILAAADASDSPIEEIELSGRLNAAIGDLRTLPLNDGRGA